MIRVGVAAHTIRSKWTVNRWHRSGTLHAVVDPTDFPDSVELGTNITVDVQFEPSDLPMLKGVVARLEGQREGSAA